MKRLLQFLFFLSLAMPALNFLLGPLAVCIVKSQLKNVFVGSQVSIGSCKFNPLSSLRFLNIDIAREPLYDFKLGEANIHYSPGSIIRGRILAIDLRKAKVALNLKDDSILAIRKYLKLKSQKSHFSIGALDLSGISLDVRAQDFKLKGKVSIAADIIGRSVSYCDLVIDSLESSGFELANASLSAGGGTASNRLFIERLQYDKLKISELQSKVVLTSANLTFCAIYGRMEGRISGDLSMSLEPGFEYMANLNLDGFSIDSFIKEAKLEEKVEMTGRLTGNMSFRGKGARITLLGGGFSAMQPGGTLTIKDNEYLNNIARDSKQPVDLLVESFRNYRYNIGSFMVKKEDNNLILNVSLEGEAGKRELTVVVHDFEWLRPE
ncbi:MAG: YdbH domain-containing protein [Candidatus Omnitrophica bacterium]|nr:YdbH domain-containing protein [Candidatus Omnitrophota bacterium]